jgi:hypothetical protein
MSDDRARVTVRLPHDAYEELCAELPSFSADTSRFQFLVQFYLDYKQLGQGPGCQCETTTDAGIPEQREPNPPLHDRSQSDSDAALDTNTESRRGPETPPQQNADHRSSNTSDRVHSRDPDQQTDGR